MALIERRHQEHPLKRSFWNELLKNEMNWPSIFGQSELHPAINIKENENAYELELFHMTLASTSFSFSLI